MPRIAEAQGRRGEIGSILFFSAPPRLCASRFGLLPKAAPSTPRSPREETRDAGQKGRVNSCNWRRMMHRGEHRGDGEKKEENYGDSLSVPSVLQGRKNLKSFPVDET